MKRLDCALNAAIASNITFLLGRTISIFRDFKAHPGLYEKLGIPWYKDVLVIAEYAIDVSKPVGQRITALTCQGKTVRDGDEFTICLNSYRASGAGGYPEYTRCPIVREINVEMSDLILDFFKSHPKLSLKTRR